MPEPTSPSALKRQLKVALNLDEDTLVEIISHHYNHIDTRFGEVVSVHLHFDRPASPSPTDPGTGVYAEVSLKPGTLSRNLKCAEIPRMPAIPVGNYIDFATWKDWADRGSVPHAFIRIIEGGGNGYFRFVSGVGYVMEIP